MRVRLLSPLLPLLALWGTPPTGAAEGPSVANGLIGGSLKAPDPGVTGLLAALHNAVGDGDTDRAVKSTRDLLSVGGRADAVAYLFRAGRGGNVKARRAALEALATVGRPVSAGTVDAFAAALVGGDRTTREIAARALRDLAGDAERALPALVASFEDESPEVRGCAAQAVGHIGVANADITKALRSLVDSEAVPRVRVRAATSLWQLTGDAAAALPILRRATTRKDAVEEALRGLQFMGTQAEPALEEIVRVFNDPTGHDRRPRNYRKQFEAGVAIAAIGPGASKAVPDLIEGFRHKSLEFQDLCAYTLKAIGPKAVPALAEALKDRDYEVRWCAALALEQMGPEAKAALPALRTASISKDEQFRDIVREAISAIEK